MRVADRVTVTPALAVAGALRVPGDKSISHRYALLAAIADGRSTIANYAPGADCASTLSLRRSPWASSHEPQRHARTNPPLVTIDGRGLRGLRAPGGAARLRQFRQHHADAGRRRRRSSLYLDPGRRRFAVAPADAADHRAAVADGRRDHGRTRRSAAGDHPRRRTLPASHFTPETPSAQVKAPCCWPACRPSGETTVLEPASTRDHTERALAAFGATASHSSTGRPIAVKGGQRLTGCATCGARRHLVGGVLGRRRGRPARLRRHDRRRRPEPEPHGAARRAAALRRRRRGDRRGRLARRAGRPSPDPARRADATS